MNQEIDEILENLKKIRADYSLVFDQAYDELIILGKIKKKEEETGERCDICGKCQKIYPISELYWDWDYGRLCQTCKHN